MKTLQTFQALVVNWTILARLFWRNRVWNASDY